MVTRNHISGFLFGWGTALVGFYFYKKHESRVDAFLSGKGIRLPGSEESVGNGSLEELVASLERPRRILLMIKAGPAVDRVARRSRVRGHRRDPPNPMWTGSRRTFRSDGPRPSLGLRPAGLGTRRPRIVVDFSGGRRGQTEHASRDFLGGGAQAHSFCRLRVRQAKRIREFCFLPTLHTLEVP